MKYIVIDNLSIEEREYDNIKDAYKDVESNNGKLIKIDNDGYEKIIEDFS